MIQDISTGSILYDEECEAALRDKHNTAFCPVQLTIPRAVHAPNRMK